jgi:hypothetical protein
MDEQFSNEEPSQQDGDNDGSGMVQQVEEVEQPQVDGSPDSNLQTEQPDQPVPSEEPVDSAPVEQDDAA